MRTGVKVADAMTTKPISAEVGTSIIECAQIMKKFDVGSILIQENGQVRGIVTEYDLTRKVIASGKNYEDSIDDVMERILVTITPDRDLHEAMEVMRENEIRHLPVIDDEKMVGVITMKDVLKIEPQLFELVVEKIRLREEARKPIGESEEGICEACSNYSENLSEIEGSKMCESCRE